jgi:muramidase (phage lysozyme)
MAGQWDAFPVARVDIPNEGRTLLDTIAGSESPSYNTIYGGGQFNDFADHPRQAVPITTGPNVGKTSSAAGRYQFLAPTWDGLKSDLQLPDFSPDSQDQAAWHLANTTYAKKTGGRDLSTDLKAAGNDPARLNMVGSYLSGVWTSLPSGIEPNKASGSFGQRYAANATTANDGWDAFPQAEMPAAPQAPGQFMAPLPDGGNARVAREGMSPPAPGLMDKLGQMWEHPAPGGLISVIKPMVQATQLPEKVYSGETQLPSTLGIPGTAPPETGQATYTPNAIGKMFLPEGTQWQAPAAGSPFAQTTTLAGATPMRSAPGGVFAAPIGKGLEVAPKPVEAVVPTLEELKAAATGKGVGYNSPEIKNLQVAPSALKEWATPTRAALEDAGLDEITAGAANKMLDKIEATSGPISGTKINSYSKSLGLMGTERQADGTLTPNAVAANQIKRALGDFVEGMGTKQAQSAESKIATEARPAASNDNPFSGAISGDAAAAANAWKTANANYAAYKTAGSIDQNVIKAENRAGATGSGQNVANTVRQRMASVMNDPGQFNRFKPDQQEMIRQIVHGTLGGNIVRFAGNAAGGGGGLGTIAAATAGGLATGGVGAMLPAVGFALKAVSNQMTLKQAAKLSESIRASSPLANAMNDFGTKAAEFSQAQTPRSIAAVSLAARNLSNNMKDAGIYLSPNEILRSLRSPVPAAADQNQGDVPRAAQ